MNKFINESPDNNCNRLFYFLQPHLLHQEHPHPKLSTGVFAIEMLTKVLLMIFFSKQPKLFAVILEAAFLSEHLIIANALLSFVLFQKNIVDNSALIIFTKCIQTIPITPV